jgi:hypothetical protein
MTDNPPAPSSGDGKGEDGPGVGTGGGIVPTERLVPAHKIKLSKRAELTTSLSEPGSEKANRVEVEYYMAHGKTISQAKQDALRNQAQPQPNGSTYHAFLFSDSPEDQEEHEKAIQGAILNPQIDEFRYERIHDGLDYNPVRIQKHTTLIAVGLLFFVAFLWYRYKFVLPVIRAEKLRARINGGQ